MKKDKQQLINFSVFFEENKANIQDLIVEIQGVNLVMKKQSCRITLPVANISTVAKNGLKLILFTKDEKRPQSDENWGQQEDEQMQEKEQINQYKQLDKILFNMINNVQKGAVFDNILKGDFQIQIHFLELNFLKHIQTQIEKLISEAETKKQESIPGMQIEDEEEEEK